MIKDWRQDMKNVQNSSYGSDQTVNGYKIERNYGKESIKNCMLQVIRMVITQNIQDKRKTI